MCPSQALAFGTREQMSRLRPQAAPINAFQFGRQVIRTKVNMMVPREHGRPEGSAQIVDVTAAMHAPTISHDILDDVFADIAGTDDGADQ